MSALHVPLIAQTGDSVHHPVRGDRNADGAQPALRVGGRPLGRRFGLAIPRPALRRQPADRHCRRHGSQPASGRTRWHGRRSSKPLSQGEQQERFRCAHPLAETARRRTASPSSAHKTTARRGLQLSQAVFIQIGNSGDIIERIDAGQATLEDGQMGRRRCDDPAAAARRPNRSAGWRSRPV